MEQQREIDRQIAMIIDRVGEKKWKEVKTQCKERDQDMQKLYESETAKQCDSRMRTLFDKGANLV